VQEQASLALPHSSNEHGIPTESSGCYGDLIFKMEKGINNEA